MFDTVTLAFLQDRQLDLAAYIYLILALITPPQASADNLSSIESFSLPPGFYCPRNSFWGARAHTAPAGYAFITSRSMEEDGRIIKVMSCEKGGRDIKTTVKDSNRIRQRKTFKSASQFRISIKQRSTG